MRSASATFANEVEEASNGARSDRNSSAAKENIAKAERPGLIFLDIEMPALNGLDTLQTDQGRSGAGGHSGGDDDRRVCGEEQMKLAAQFGANSYTLQTRQRRTVFEDGPGQHELLADGSPISHGIIWRRSNAGVKRKWPSNFSYIVSRR